MGKGKHIILLSANGDIIPDMLIYKRGNLLEASCSLAHCVSADLAMRRGIASEFRKKFGRMSELKLQKAEVGQIAVLKCDNRYVFCLITKARYYEKPTMETIRSSLIQLKHFMIKNDLTLIAIPKLASGHDRMLWPNVEQLLKEIFDNSNILIIVHTLV